MGARGAGHGPSTVQRRPMGHPVAVCPEGPLTSRIQHANQFSTSGGDKAQNFNLNLLVAFLFSFFFSLSTVLGG